jgi:hypothetical protein
VSLRGALAGSPERRILPHTAAPLLDAGPCLFPRPLVPGPDRSRHHRAHQVGEIRQQQFRFSWSTVRFTATNQASPVPVMASPVQPEEASPHHAVACRGRRSGRRFLRALPRREAESPGGRSRSHQAGLPACLPRAGRCRARPKAGPRSAVPSSCVRATAPGARHGPAANEPTYPGGESPGPGPARAATGVRLGPVPARARAAGFSVTVRQGHEADTDVSGGNFEKRGKGRALGRGACSTGTARADVGGWVR